MLGVCQTTHGRKTRRWSARRYDTCSQRRLFYLADPFPPDPLKSPVFMVRLASWANRSAGWANGPEGRNRDNGSFGSAVGRMFARGFGKSFGLKPGEKPASPRAKASWLAAGSIRPSGAWPQANPNQQAGQWYLDDAHESRALSARARKRHQPIPPGTADSLLSVRRPHQELLLNHEVTRNGSRGHGPRAAAATAFAGPAPFTGLAKGQAGRLRPAYGLRRLHSSCSQRSSARVRAVRRLRRRGPASAEEAGPQAPLTGAPDELCAYRRGGMPRRFSRCAVLLAVVAVVVGVQALHRSVGHCRVQ